MLLHVRCLSLIFTRKTEIFLSFTHVTSSYSTLKLKKTDRNKKNQIKPRQNAQVRKKAKKDSTTTALFHWPIGRKKQIAGKPGRISARGIVAMDEMG